MKVTEIGIQRIVVLILLATLMGQSFVLGKNSKTRDRALAQTKECLELANQQKDFIRELQAEARKQSVVIRRPGRI